MLSSRSDEFGLVHERRDETGENDAASAREEVEQAERARPRWARGSSLAGGSTVARTVARGRIDGLSALQKLLATGPAQHSIRAHDETGNDT